MLEEKGDKLIGKMATSLWRSSIIERLPLRACHPQIFLKHFPNDTVLRYLLSDVMFIIFQSVVFHHK